MNPMHTSRRQRVESPSRVPARRAFTLIELIVVVGIIVLLAGLTVALVAALNRGSETRVTENLLKLVDAAYAEWKTTADRDLSYGVDNTPIGVVYDVKQLAPNGVNDHDPTDELTDDLMASSTSREMFKNVDSKLLKPSSTGHAGAQLVDAWGTEIITVFPGRKWFVGDTYPKDVDGTIRTEFEQAFGVCTNHRVRFVSAGPDGRFGNLAYTGANQATIDDAKDNLYSYPLEAP